jgi:hypothetical protein
MEKFIKGYFHWLIISINYGKVYQRVFPLVDHLDQLWKRLSEGTSVGWSPASTIERFIKGYFSWLIISINYGKVYQRVFPLIDHLDQLWKRLLNGISVGWSTALTMDRFIEGNVWWLIIPIKHKSSSKNSWNGCRLSWTSKGFLTR